MSLVTWAKTNSRAVGKIALYGTGAVLIAWPLVDFGSSLYAGGSVKNSARDAIIRGYGVNPEAGTINSVGLRNGAIRTGLGALAVLAARKI